MSSQEQPHHRLQAQGEAQERAVATLAPRQPRRRSRRRRKGLRHRIQRTVHLEVQVTALTSRFLRNQGILKARPKHRIFVARVMYAATSHGSVTGVARTKATTTIGTFCPTIVRAVRRQEKLTLRKTNGVTARKKKMWQKLRRKMRPKTIGKSESVRVHRRQRPTSRISQKKEMTMKHQF